MNNQYPGVSDKESIFDKSESKSEINIGRAARGRNRLGKSYYGQTINLPCKPDDIFYIHEKKDCCKCEQACSNKDASDTPLCPYKKVECKVDTVTYILKRNETRVIINGYYKYEDVLFSEG